MMKSGRQIVASAMRDALAHAAGQLVRIGVQHRRVELDPRQMGDDLLLELLPAAADVRIREIDESRSKPAQRIQHVHRALHDVGKVPPADPRHLSRWSAVHSAVAGQESEIHAAADDLQWRPDRADDSLDQRGLAGARLAGEPVDLVALNVQS